MSRHVEIIVTDKTRSEFFEALSEVQAAVDRGETTWPEFTLGCERHYLAEALRRFDEALPGRLSEVLP